MPDTEPQNNAPPKPSTLATFLATGFYSGYIPWASGTFGSLVGVFIYVIPGFDSPFVLYPLILGGFVLGAFVSDQVALYQGNKLTKTAEFAKEKFQGGGHTAPDPSIVVIDEIIGMLISLAFVEKSFLSIGIAFIAFRLFDIVKPFPARQCEHIPNGWGIMLDDVVAGIYANIATHLILLSIRYFL